MQYLISFPINRKVRKILDGLKPRIEEKLSYEVVTKYKIH